MKFLKYINILFISAVIAMGCEPLEEVYDELEEKELEEGSDQTFIYTLTSDDYATVAGIALAMETKEDSAAADFIESNEAFSPDYEAKKYLPTFVDGAFAFHGKGTAVKVNYNLFTGDSEAFSAYLTAPKFELEQADYESYSAESGKFGFFDSSVDADKFLTEWLLTKVQDPVEGDIVSTTYDRIDQRYSELSGEEVFSEDFELEENGLGQFTATDLLGAQAWEWDSFSGATWAKMSGYASGAQDNDDWLISSEIDLSGATGDINVTITQIWNYASTEWGEEIDILYSTDYAGDVAAATWTSVDLDVVPEGTGWSEFVGSATLPDVQGGSLYLGFHYTSSTAVGACTWEIVDVVVEEGAAPVIDYVNGFYEFDGEKWVSMDDEVAYLGSKDYNMMGAPGTYDNFSSSTPSSDYLPTYLSQMFPFAVEGDSYDVVFRYYNGRTVTLAEEYTFTGGAWMGSFYEEQVEQYKHDGTSFVFDPSVVFTMTSSDYQIIVDEVAKTHPDLVDGFGTGEFYYGAGAYYSNFDIRLDKRTTGDFAQAEYAELSADDGKALIIERMAEGIQLLLEKKFSDATMVSGVDVYYTVKCATYDGSDANWQTVFILIGTGEFELFEAPVIIE
ncbi:choice-of-anchor J domain-containing protein [Reichenbachiella ulvae]|uniref:Choice-of-anchor J domain-containing protein n=1 Tax=Reichenbachiella ulvae TaxID=2980104 RepID=A0ABT3CTQ4_9BACT|nr:choice-of-anchor J domain-containing protein [Reichenbachiella ulvae]MCV9386914.1 choice-of-anchor J domain-containing protein [Reichenbachiella ulvae]